MVNSSVYHEYYVANHLLRGYMQDVESETLYQKYWYMLILTTNKYVYEPFTLVVQELL